MKIEQLVDVLGFEKIGETLYRKAFENAGCDLYVDISEKSLIYPLEVTGFIVNEKQTCSFNKPENFVVFECVHRLLCKGYKPGHIELEPRWKVGHGASGGRADILVKDNEGKAILIIECKTWGVEFENEWKNMLEDGGQLFSYAQQVGTKPWLCLYTSEIEGESLTYESRIITLKENVEYLKMLEDPYSYTTAADVRSLYTAWFVTYNHDFATMGIFEDIYPAYEIGKQKHTIADLKEINHDDIQKKYNTFATILRKYNVSGRENAFDKLVNLFLAKIVDEMRDPDEELMFHWRGVAFDDYYLMLDRLQRLYRDGIMKFLGEEVTYIDDSQIHNAFRLFINDPDATRDTIKYYFRQLKYYRNNDFAFLDVHNERLFLQNSVILLEIVKMMQDMKLKTDKQNQFLGDLFEGFLDQGIRQSEGQFFTPTPIVKFIVSSLPLETLINDNPDPLNVIDFACGAGHFLNEYASQVRAFLQPDQLSEYYKGIIGIEKEYRLSKVAKVSAFMYGQDNIQTRYADALAENTDIKDGSFHILISNPPYSVKGFLGTLSKERRDTFETMKAIDTGSIASNNSIEVFFLERAKQLLVPGGVMAIILPSSFLSKSNAVYIKARELILQHFDVVAIAEFGSGTFGKTGTNTITLFLRRKVEDPALAVHYLYRVGTWFKDDYNKDHVFDDSNLLAAYCLHIGYSLDDYKTFLKAIPNKAILETDIFIAYRQAFDKLAETKNYIRRQSFQRLPENKQKAELDNRFLAYACDLEKDKLFYFMLAYTNPQSVVVVKAPTDTSDSKRFLGYEWSNRKGSEGIKYIGTVINTSQNDEESDNPDNSIIIPTIEGINRINTPLFNPYNLADECKINSIIRANFNGIMQGESEFVSRYKLVDMLDFSGVKFEKQISLTSGKEVDSNGNYPIINNGAGITSKFPIKHLEDILIEIDGAKTKIPQNNILLTGDIPVVSQLLDNQIEGYSNGVEPITDLPLIVFGDHSCAIKYIDFQFVRGADGTQLLKIDNKQAITKYIYYVIRNAKITNSTKYERHFKYLKQVKIPLPPLEIQREIVTACEAVDSEYESIQKSMEGYRQSIENISYEMEILNYNGSIELTSNYPLVAISKHFAYSTSRIDTTNLSTDNYVGVDNLLQNKEGKKQSDFVPQEGSVTKYIYGDILVSNIRPYLKKIWFADKDGGCSGDVLVIHSLDDIVNSKYLYYLLARDAFFNYVMQFTKGVKMPRGDKGKILQYKIPIPPLMIQNELVEKAELLEEKIANAQETLRKLDSKREEILAEYLN